MDIRDKLMAGWLMGENGCWIWQKGKSNGYGMIEGKLAHRIAYETFIGPIPDGLQLDHLCRNRACINVEHLEPVTMQENVLRSPITTNGLRRLQVCKEGHSVTGGNRYVKKNGSIRCRICHKEKARARRAELLWT